MDLIASFLLQRQTETNSFMYCSPLDGDRPMERKIIVNEQIFYRNIHGSYMIVIIKSSELQA
jgi:hypothetical protein